MDCFICGKPIVSSAWQSLILEGVTTFRERMAAETDPENPRPYRISVCTLQFKTGDELLDIIKTDCVEKAKDMGYGPDPKRHPPRR